MLPPGASVRVYPGFRSSLGTILFPGNDVFARQMQDRFSQMLAKHLAEGGSMHVVEIGACLAEFVPIEIVECAEPGWKQRLLQQWERDQRPQMFAALEAYFLDGGCEARLADQTAFLVALRGAGVTIEGESALFAELVAAGDWQATFLLHCQFGRGQGIRLRGLRVDREHLLAVAHAAGFSAHHAQQLASEVVREVTSAALPQASWWPFSRRR